MQQTITVGTNTDYMIGVSAAKNGELLDLRPQDVTLTIGENVLTSEKLINGYVVFDYSQGRTPVSEIVKVTILDTHFDLLIVGKFSSKGDVGGSGGVAEETDPVFVEKCLSADSIVLGKNSTNPTGTNTVAIGTNSITQSDNTIAIGNGAIAYEEETIAIGRGATANFKYSIAIGNGTFISGNKSIAIGLSAHPLDNSVAIGCGTDTGNNGITIGCDAKGGDKSIVLGELANVNYYNYCIAIGYLAQVNGEGGIAIGNETFSDFSSIAIGNQSRANKIYTIQLGYGTNDNESTFQVWDHTLLNKETGLIPPERLGTGYDSSQRQVLVNNYGTLTWETYNG